MPSYRLWFSVTVACLIVGRAARAPAQDRCDERMGCYIDASGKERSADDDYRSLHSYPDPHYLRAALEESLFLVLGISWYWIDRGRNKADWDFPSAKQRFSADILRFDNNTFPINFIWHPLSGGAYYMAARTNGMHLGPTLVYATLTPLVWEYGLEFRERVSINDLITTPVAGIAIGEVWSRLAWLVNRPVYGHTRARRAGAYSFGLLQNIHDRMDGVAKTSSAAAPWRALSAHGGASVTRAQDHHTVAASMAFEGRFVAVPSYLRVGRYSRWFFDADQARLTLDAQVASATQGEIDLYVDTTLAGFYAQQLTADRTGTSVLVGVGVGFRYRRVQLPGFHDDLSVTHLPGLMLDLDELGRSALIHGALRVSPDFAGVRVWPFARWDEANADELTKTVLHRYGYAYSFGGSVQASLELVFSAARLGASAMMGQYDSKQGLDRNQELLTTDVRTSNTVFDAQGFVRVYPLPAHKLSLSVCVLTRRRISQVNQYEERGSLLRGAATLGWEL